MQQLRSRAAEGSTASGGFYVCCRRASASRSSRRDYPSESSSSPAESSSSSAQGAACPTQKAGRGLKADPSSRICFEPPFQAVRVGKTNLMATAEYPVGYSSGR
jgi:hypothetical protein